MLKKLPASGRGGGTTDARNNRATRRQKLHREGAGRPIVLAQVREKEKIEGKINQSQEETRKKNEEFQE